MGVTNAPLPDGFSSIITFSLAPLVTFFEKTVQPPDLDAGGSIDLTNMRNTRLRTFAGKSLVTLGNMSIKGLYNVQALAEFFGMLGLNQTITFTYPNGFTEIVQAFVNKFTQDALEEGKAPEATVELIASNRNSAGAETALTFGTPGPTTTTTTEGP